MKEILEKNDLLKPPKVGDIVEARLVGRGRSALFFDLGPFGTGIIYGREFYESKEELKKMKEGEKIFAKIIDLENEEGYVELSLSGASREMAFEAVRQKKEKGETLSVKILGANKGGLVSEVSGIPAFLPVSQLSPEHYPRVEDADKTKIVRELQKFIGQSLDVKILNFSQRDGQIILSEKAKTLEDKKESLKKYNLGDVIEGEISGITNFGVFIKFKPRKDPESGQSEEEEGIEGLCHISELDWKIVKEPSEVVKVGDRVKAKIIDIQNGRVFLSLKALKPDPWKGIGEKYKKGDIVSGKVTRFNPFGAFVQISPKIQGLCHISEFEPGEMEKSLQVGKKYDFQILFIDENAHKMSLRLAKDDKESN